jgi:RNA polymerase primary sigma factor
MQPFEGLGVLRGRHSRGSDCLTYATWWIRQSVARPIENQGRTIRLPVHVSTRMRRLWRVSNQMARTVGRKPKTEELARALGAPPHRVTWTTQASQLPLSLEEPRNDWQDRVLSDLIVDEASQAPEVQAARNLQRAQLRENLDSLPPGEAQVLSLCYGSADGKAHTLQEVGDKLGVTRERVRQIEAQALRRLRTSEGQRRLRDYLGTVLGCATIQARPGQRVHTSRPSGTCLSTEIQEL